MKYSNRWCVYSYRLFLCTLTIMVLFTTVFATDIAPYASKYISSYDRYIWRNTDGSIGVEFDITGTGTMDQIGATKIVIQRQSGNSWIDVKTYTSSTTSALMGTNTYYHTASVTYYGATSGYSYRARISIYAGNSSGSDSRVITTTTA